MWFRSGVILLGGFLAAAAAANADLSLEWTGRFAGQISDYGLSAAIARGEEVPLELIPYDLINPLFSDYADKRRYVFLPKGSTMQFDPGAAFSFPVGAVLIKSFLYPEGEHRRLIETRLMFHTPDGWNGAAYVWNEAQRDAALKVAGAQVPVSWRDERGELRSTGYLVPDMNQCKMCHRETGEMGPIGLKARHLNRDYEYADGVENQLVRWMRAGRLSGAPKDPGLIPRTPDASDADLPIALRAEAYFDMNCAHCHNPAGLGSHTRLDLRPRQTDPHARGIMKSPTSAGNAARGRLYAVVPGDPEASFLLHRLKSVRPDVRMPPVGRTVADEEGVKLIAEWIRSLERETTPDVR